MAHDKAGATETINLAADPDIVERLKALTGSRGPDAVIDAVGMGLTVKTRLRDFQAQADECMKVVPRPEGRSGAGATHLTADSLGAPTPRGRRRSLEPLGLDGLPRHPEAPEGRGRAGDHGGWTADERAPVRGVRRREAAQEGLVDPTLLAAPARLRP